MKAEMEEKNARVLQMHVADSGKPKKRSLGILARNS